MNRLVLPVSAMDVAVPTIRLARPDEIAVLVAIDDDAGRLYAEVGLPIELAPDHPFLVAEQARWRHAAGLEQVFLAVDAEGRGIGFAALGWVDGEPYLEQLSVRSDAMRRGLGRRLLRRAVDWAAQQGSSSLWLTTYGHLSFNRAFYEREGFVVVAESEWLPDIAHHIAEERGCLPDPEQRIAMRRAL